MGLKNISRRKFLAQTGCAAMGSTTLFSSLANLSLVNKLIGTASTPPSDYKALVCILLAGGNDSFNMLMPHGNDEYADYAATRSDLAIPQGDLLNLNYTAPNGKIFGAHPSMGGVQQMFEAGELAYISNVGTLIEPIANSTEYFSGLKNLPLGLFSHSDQIQQWQTAIPQSREAIGWGGRMADIVKTMNTNQGISMNISLSGRNVFQSGNTVLEYSISNQGNGVEGIEKINQWKSDSGLINNIRTEAVSDMATHMYANIFKQTLGELTDQSMESLEVFQNALSSVPPFATNFSDHYLSQNLKMVARTIGAKDDLGMKRQTFFMTIGGWDHHNELLANQEFLLAVVSNAIKEFFDALKEVGLENDVTLFTVSDFARTLTSNGKGSDHAWGGNSIVAGGAVNGKKIYGDYPDLYLSGNDLIINGRGNLIPTTSADEYFAELALWFGVSPSDLHLILPNITNFYSPGGSAPLGFLL
ncbi:MAG: DUF1501 domain-containing protein [Bacteroidetes bacterium]|nr:DUF1501 domain-containing protein [Bacteroidota bacterium]